MEDKQLNQDEKKNNKPSKKEKDNKDKDKKKKKKNNNNLGDWFKNNLKFILICVFSFFITVNIFSFIYEEINKPEEVIYNEFRTLLKDKKVEEIYIDFSLGTFNYKLKEKEKLYKTDNPRKEGFKEELLKSEVKVLESNSLNKKNNFLLVFQLLVWVLIIFFFFKMMNVGGIDLKNKKDELKTKVTFKDIAGNKEAISEMKTIVEFMKNQDKYKKIGAKLPKGAILYGPPGTGKTLLAKAIAGEADASFYSINGSEFVEKYVGVGASRARKLFKTAKKNAPAIIFIDEIDAIGGHRGTDNNSEREQTLNQILSELDGFDLSSNIFVIAATNRLETLDAALTRPGRFDKFISIPNPKMEERLEILELYAKKKKMAKDVNLKNLAKVTVNMAGASLESLVNEAAIIAITNGREEVRNEDLEEAYLKLVIKGNIRKDQQLNRLEEEIELVAWHEAGHAIMSLKNGMNVPITTILSSTTGAGGITFSTHKKDGLFSKKEMQEYVQMLYAGRVCEFLLFNEDESRITIGASSDIEQSSKIIRDYIVSYGLSEKFGMFSPTAIKADVNDLVVEESIKLSKTLYNETLNYLRKNKELVEIVANALIEYNTIDENQLIEIVDNYEKEKNNKLKK